MFPWHWQPYAWGRSDFQHDLDRCLYSVTFYCQASSSNNDFSSFVGNPVLPTTLRRGPKRAWVVTLWITGRGSVSSAQNSVVLALTLPLTGELKLNITGTAGRAKLFHYFSSSLPQRAHCWRVGPLLSTSHFHLLSCDLKLGPGLANLNKEQPNQRGT